MLISRKLSDLGVRVQKRPYRKVPTARRLATASTTSRDSVTSYSWRHNLQSRRIPKLRHGSTIRVEPLSTHYRRTLCLKIGLFGLEHEFR